MLIMPSFKKSLIVEQFQGNYLESNVKLVTDENKYRDSFVVCMIADISLFHSTKHVWPTIDRMFV